MQNFQVYAALKDFLQIAFCELHDHINRGKILWVDWLANFNQLNDTRMSQFSEKSDLSKNSFAVDIVLENVVHLFDGDSFSG
jgi:hypothetical protein